MRHGSKEAEVSTVAAVLVLGPDVDSGKHPGSLASHPARRSLPGPPAPSPPPPALEGFAGFDLSGVEGDATVVKLGRVKFASRLIVMCVP